MLNHLQFCPASRPALIKLWPVHPICVDLTLSNTSKCHGVVNSSTTVILGHCFFKLLRLLRPGFQRVLPEIARSGGWILLPPRSTGLREPGKAGVFFVAVRLSSSGFYTPCLVRFLHTFILFECLWLFHCKRDPPLQICRHECKLISNIYIY